MSFSRILAITFLSFNAIGMFVDGLGHGVQPFRAYFIFFQAGQRWGMFSTAPRVDEVRVVVSIDGHESDPILPGLVKDLDPFRYKTFWLYLTQADGMARERYLRMLCKNAAYYFGIVPVVSVRVEQRVIYGDWQTIPIGDRPCSEFV